MDFSQVNAALLTLLTLIGGTGVTMLWNFSSELVKVKVDIGTLRAEVTALTRSLDKLVNFSMEHSHV